MDFSPCKTCGGDFDNAWMPVAGDGMCYKCDGQKIHVICGGGGCDDCRRTGTCPVCKGSGKCGICGGKGKLLSTGHRKVIRRS